MNCIDCENPSVADERRCAECVEEVREMPGWRQAPRSNGRVNPPPDGQCCPACERSLRLGRRGKWCSEACRAWARQHPGEIRTDSVCRGCGDRFRPAGSDKWCVGCRSSALTCEQCVESMPWRLSQDGMPARFCSARCANLARSRPAVQCIEAGCGKPSRTRGRCKNHYSSWYYSPEGPGADKNRDGNPLLRKARGRAATHRRKTAGRYGDVTPAYEQALRDKAKCCPLCRVRLIVQPYQPASKELDHIVPLGVGGTHTIGNVRIICRSCNLKRPKDGSDYFGPVTLWAQVG